jgi:hypothetical protein
LREHRLAVDKDVALFRFFQSGDAAQGGRFAASARPRSVSISYFTSRLM